MPKDLLIILDFHTNLALRSQSEQTDVFQEVQAGVPTPREFVELTIRSSIKTHVEGYYLIESESSLHGKTGYPFLMNVDGQAVTWKVDGQEENTPTPCESEERSEGGKGRKYDLHKKISLRAGSHKIFFALPEEDVFLQFELALRAGESYVLEFSPVYKHEVSLSRRYGEKKPPHFLHGVSRFKVFLNGNAIKSLK